MFTAAPAVDLGPAKPDAMISVELSGGMMNYDWAINGQTFAHGRPLTVKQDQRVTLTFNNMSMMWHPMHLHGHTFQVIKPDGSGGPRKDTVIVPPMQMLTIDLVADNPGVWMLHCHNAYHIEAGMMTSLDYVV
jgi:multicopper oxidase